MNALVIVAAGRGSRAGSAGDEPKQYLEIGGRTVLARTLDAFAHMARFEPILVVIHPDDRALYDRAITGFEDLLSGPVCGGATRQQSVLAGLEALVPANPERVLIHDAARPFVGPALISRVLDGLDHASGTIPGLAVSDTLKRTREAADGCGGAGGPGGAGRILETVPRAGLWRAQTPQGFRFTGILAAHRAAAKSGRDDFTDDASIAEWAGLGVTVVAGSERNIKLTTPEDLAMAERMFPTGSGGRPDEIRVGTGFDVHRLGADRPLILCGIEISHDRGLIGHSDADVALHALTDALLGALGDGDIGTHFPPDDVRWRNASSDLFLADAAARIAAREGRIIHVDLTLVCESPRVSRYRRSMCLRIGEILRLAPGRVSVKATTSEGLGFTGRREGIAAMASATVRLPPAD